MSSTSSAFAGNVSKALREAGIAVRYSGSSLTDPGVRVSRGTGRNVQSATVSVSFDLPAKEARVTRMVIEALTDAGYVVDQSVAADGIISVTPNSEESR